MGLTLSHNAQLAHTGGQMNPKELKQMAVGTK